MQTVTTVGFDIAKSVFQVHGVDAAGQVVKRRQVLAFFQNLPSMAPGIGPGLLALLSRRPTKVAAIGRHYGQRSCEPR